MLQLPDSTWVNLSSQSQVKICKVMDKSHSSSLTNPIPMVTRSLLVEADFTWSVTVPGKVIQRSVCSALDKFPQIVSNNTVFRNLLDAVFTLHTCVGNPEEQFVSLVRRRKGRVGKGEVHSAVLDDYFPIELEGVTYSETVHGSSCEMLAKQQRCVSCRAYRPTLRALSSQEKNILPTTPTKRTSSSSHVNFRYLSTPEKVRRLANCSSRAKLALREIEKLKQKLADLEARDGIALEESLSDDFATIFAESTEEVKGSFPTGSFDRLFWDQLLNVRKSKSDGTQ